MPDGDAESSAIGICGPVIPGTLVEILVAGDFTLSLGYASSESLSIADSRCSFLFLFVQPLRELDSFWKADRCALLDSLSASAHGSCNRADGSLVRKNLLLCGVCVLSTLGFLSQSLPLRLRSCLISIRSLRCAVWVLLCVLLDDLRPYRCFDVILGSCDCLIQYTAMVNLLCLLLVI